MNDQHGPNDPEEDGDSLSDFEAVIDGEIDGEDQEEDQEEDTDSSDEEG